VNPRTLLLPTLVLALSLTACSRHANEAPFSGYAEAELVYLAAPAAGTLLTLAVQRGDSVKRDQVLYTLDADAEALGREGAQARSDAALAQAADLRKGKRPNELAAIDQQLAQARAALGSSTSQLERNQRLVAQGFVSPAQLDTLVAARDRDAAGVRELLAERATAVEAARVDAIAAAAAQARGAQADLSLARWHESQKQRNAPGDALVFDTLYRVGEWVPAGTPVVVLLPPGAVKLRFFVPQPMLARVAVGGTVSVACDGCPAGLSARIDYVSPQAEFTPPVIYSNESRSKLVFMVEARPTGNSPLKPGQPVEVHLLPASPP
jgi:HlyD family secretion protein